MSQRIKLENQRFERLVVLEYCGMKKSGSYKRSVYLCKCDCGKILEVVGQNLKTGNSKSCGCLAREKRSGENSILWKGVGKLKAEFNRQRRGAVSRGLEFSLTVGQVESLFNSNCFYCDSEPVQDNRGLIRNGIDRLDSTKGYVFSNTVPCCAQCNEMKNSTSYGEFLHKITKIYHHLIKE